MRDDVGLIHLGGYATITAVLALAEWSGPSALIVALPLCLIALYCGLRHGTEWLVESARETTSDPRLSRQPDTQVSTDGGTVRTNRDSVPNRSVNEDN